MDLYLKATLETLIMTLSSSFLAIILGLPLGIVLFNCSDKGLKPNRILYGSLGTIVNVFRSIPFVLLLLYVMPLSRLLVKTTIGVKAMIPALSISAIPFVARLVENSLSEVDSNLIEAARSMGAKNSQIIKHVLLVEAQASLINAATITIITILGYGAMSGFVGAGGLGTLAINYGYYRSNYQIMTICIILLILLVQLFQSIGQWIIKRVSRK